MNTAENPSMVAQIRERIEQEAIAMQQGMSGFASGMARHRFIQAKVKRMQEEQAQLSEIVGEQEATRILCETYHKIMS